MENIYREALTLTEFVTNMYDDMFSHSQRCAGSEAIPQAPGQAAPIVTYKMYYDAAISRHRLTAMWGNGYERLRDDLEKQVGAQMMAFLAEDHAAPLDVVCTIVQNKMAREIGRHGPAAFLKGDQQDSKDPMFLLVLRTCARVWADKIATAKAMTSVDVLEKFAEDMAQTRAQRDRNANNSEDWTRHADLMIRSALDQARAMLAAFDQGLAKMEAPAERVQGNRAAAEGHPGPVDSIRISDRRPSDDRGDDAPTAAVATTRPAAGRNGR